MIDQRERALVRRSSDCAVLALRAEKECAERANHEKTHFLAVASHDLRQPIHALGLYISELRRKISGAEQIHLVEQVERSVESLSLLINSLLDISKLDAGLIVAQKQDCDLALLLQHLADDFHAEAQSKNIRLRIRPFQGSVQSDPVLLERIIVNLLANALRYTPPNGIVMVLCRKRGDSIHLEVRDNGFGIEPAYQACIFKEFFQINSPQTAGHQGLGLGLSIVDRLVHLLEHRITLTSQLNKGAKFTLVLPQVAENSCPDTSKTQIELDFPAADSPLNGKRLLVVEADSLVREGTAILLTSWGYRVSAAASLEDALEQLNDENWDLIISGDRQHDAGSGLEVIERVRQKQQRCVPGIIISAAAPSGIYPASETTVLQKPVKPAKLRSLVHFLLKESVQ